MVMLRMTHTELLQALFPEDRSATQEPDGQASKTDDDDDGDGDPAECLDDMSCHDFAALTEGQLSVTGVYRLSSHMRECDSCKYLFASMICEVRRAKALDNFDDCDDSEGYDDFEGCDG
jgi:hypothetical protein